MIVRLLGDDYTAAYLAARTVVENLGHKVDDGSHCVVDLAIAPLLTRIIPAGELAAPTLGTLIFHPSPLPYGRGASAIKWAYRRKEPVTAATWFWADNGIDTGDICEQEVIKIDHGISPREFYNQDVILAMVRTLKRAITDLGRGVVRRVPQEERYASFDYRI